MTGDELRALAEANDLDISEIAKHADLNAQGLYKKTGEKKYSPKSTRKILEAVQDLRKLKKSLSIAG